MTPSSTPPVLDLVPVPLSAASQRILEHVAIQDELDHLLRTLATLADSSERCADLLGARIRKLSNQLFAL